MAQLSRGLRNNNPLNIRKSACKWQGKINPSTDRSFEQFSSIVYGLRAAFIIIQTYVRKHHAVTVAAVIYRWAPVSENNTENYIKNVCSLTNFHRSAPICLTNSSFMCRLVSAMARMECGAILPYDIIKKAYDLSGLAS